MKTVVVAIALGLCGCLAINASTCPSGLQCPSGKVCVAALDLCVDPEELEQCLGTDASTCDAAGNQPGYCSNGLCFASCGNGVIEDDIREECEGDPPSELTCTAQGFDRGTSACSNSCLVVSSCARIGWTEVFPQAPVLGYTDALAFSENQILAVGSDRFLDYIPAGFMAVLDGDEWVTPLLLDGGQPPLQAVAGNSPDDVFVVGAEGFLAHWNGLDLEILEAAPVLEPVVADKKPADLWDLWIDPESGRLVVAASGAVFEYAAGQWTTLHLAPTSSYVYYDVVGTPAGELYAVGGFPSDGPSTGVIAEFDGVQWNDDVVTVPNSMFHAVAVTSLNQIIAVGDNGAVAMSSDNTWSTSEVLATGNLESATATFALRDVSVVDMDDVYIAGSTVLHDNESQEVLVTRPALLRRIGLNEWLPAETDAAGAITSVSGLSNDYTVITAAGHLFESSGSHWSVQSQVGGTGLVLFDTHRGAIITLDGFLRIFDGHSIGDPVNTAIIAPQLAANETGVFAAGLHGPDVILQRLPVRGMISRIDNETTVVVVLEPPEPIGMLRAAGTDLLALSATKLYHHDGSTWTTIDGPSNALLLSLHGTQPTNVMVGGERSDGLGALWQLDGTTWVELQTFPSTVSNVWSIGDFVGVGTRDGRLHTNDGAEWTVVDLVGNGPVTSIHGSGPSDIFATFSVGGLAHFDGVEWNPVNSPVGNPSGIHATPETVVIWGSSLAFLERRKAW